MMSQSDSYFRPDLIELLAGDALGELDTTEQQRLLQSLSDTDQQNADELHVAAAALQLVLAEPDSTSMPVDLRSRIAAEAFSYLSTHPSDAQVQLVVRGETTEALSWRERLAWLTAAATLILALGFWALSRPVDENAKIALSPAQARADLMAQVNDGVEVAWTAGTTPFDVSVFGDVVWSNSRQQGFLRFVGMPINDPSSEQYQLWIIDPMRDDEPIDGGVFDVTGEGEVIIPIDAKLLVINPAAFAVTIEKPGGVVVSDQKRLPLLAKVLTPKG